ncbi:hypothetical protein ACHHYP_00656 [Achlya hypogyna]|uniref:CIP2A N-terminal domain-containing protein n=1 Tax=Achlya hypogyna TaxID=1202772 RepID=A0A1V9ZU49_ACHHY|nr:hypothetical protein ACHHYP_00656 [Achlya hypogyna]
MIAGDPRRTSSFLGHLGTTRREVHAIAEAFVSSYHNPALRGTLDGAQHELRVGLRSTQFVEHIKALPSSTFQALVDVVARMSIDSESNRLEEEMLVVLGTITPGVLVGYPTPPLAKLLQALIHTLIRDILHDTDVDSEAQDTAFLIHLQTLAGCLHGNVGVRLFVAELPERKDLVRTLAVMLNRTDDSSVLIYSMSILARLVLSEPVGRKLFQAKNVDQALGLICTVVADKDNTVLLLSLDNVATKERIGLQTASVDLLADLATQPWILAAFEASEELRHLTHTLLQDRFHLHEGSALGLQIAIYYLTTLAGLSHRFRRDLVKQVPNLSLALPVVLHPIPSIATAAAQFFVTLLGDDRAVVDALVDTCPELADGASREPASLQPTLTDLFRRLHTTIAVLVREVGDVDTDAFDDLITSPDYEYAVQVCQLLSRLSQDRRVWAMSVELVNMTQLTALAQREAQFMASLSAERWLQFTPRFSLAFLTLIGTLLLHNDLRDDAVLREFNHVLQIPEVAAMVSRGLCQYENKQWTRDVLGFLRKFLSQAKSQAFHERINLMTLADGLFAYHQRVHDVVTTARSAVDKADAALAGVSKQLDAAKAELDVATTAGAEALAHERELRQRLEVDLAQQLAAKDRAVAAVQKAHEVQIARYQQQLEAADLQLEAKDRALEKQQRALQENRLHRCSTEEENKGLRRKLHVLEMRIDEVAEAHASTRLDVGAKEQARRELQIEFENMSEAFAAQSAELLSLQEEMATTRAATREREAKMEATYKQLVLLAKAHQLQSDEFSKTIEERDQLEAQVSATRDALASLTRRFEDQRAQLQTSIEATAALDAAVARSEQRRHEEQTTAEALLRERDELQRQCQQLMNEALAKDRRLAEAVHALSAKDKIIDERKDDVRRLKLELEKHTQLQAMIHQLSSHSSEASAPATLSQQLPAPFYAPAYAPGFVPESQFSQ